MAIPKPAPPPPAVDDPAIEEQAPPQVEIPAESRYQILGILGQGGMLTTYKALDLQTNSIVVLMPAPVGAEPAEQPDELPAAGSPRMRGVDFERPSSQTQTVPHQPDDDAKQKEETPPRSVAEELSDLKEAAGVLRHASPPEPKPGAALDDTVIEKSPPERAEETDASTLETMVSGRRERKAAQQEAPTEVELFGGERRMAARDEEVEAGEEDEVEMAEEEEASPADEAPAAAVTAAPPPAPPAPSPDEAPTIVGSGAPPPPPAPAAAPAPQVPPKLDIDGDVHGDVEVAGGNIIKTNGGNVVVFENKEQALKYEKQARRFDTAFPDKAELNEIAVLWVSVSKPGDPPPFEGVPVETIVAGPTADIPMPVDAKTGKLQEVHIDVQVRAPQYEPSKDTATLTVHPDGKADKVRFLLEAQNEGKGIILVQFYLDKKRLGEVEIKSVVEKARAGTKFAFSLQVASIYLAFGVA
jgi:hypothetical protein